MTENSEKTETASGNAPENARVGMNGTQDLNRPVVGQTMIVRGQVCTITYVYEFGTVAVVSPSGKAYHVSGLSFV